MKPTDLNSDGFIWSESWQEALMGHIFEDARFALRCIEFLKPGWFTSGLALQQIWTSYLAFYKRVGRLPQFTKEDLKTEVKTTFEILDDGIFLELEPADVEKYRVLLHRCATVSIHGFPLDEIKKNLTGFARANIFKETMTGAVDQYKSRFYDNAYDWTRKKLEEIDKTDFEGDLLAMDLKSPGDWLFKEEKRKDMAISTGCAALDKALGGGLFRGETTAIMAPTNTGKTTAMITMVRHALVNGNRVLLMTHEGRPEAIRLMILAALVGIPRRDLSGVWTQESGRKIIEEAAELMHKSLTFIPYTFTGKMYIENVTNEIIKRCETAKRNHEKPYDLLVDDYPKKLRSKSRAGSKDIAYRAELAEIYDQFNHLSAELNLHALVAIQTNRQGSRQNRGTVDTDQLLGMEEIDESFGVAQNMANIITLNRSGVDAKANILSYNIAKSRNDATDVTVSTRTAYHTSLTHGDMGMFLKFGRLFLIRDKFEEMDIITQQMKTIKPYAMGLASFLIESNFKENTATLDGILTGIARGQIKTVEGKITTDEIIKHKRTEVEEKSAATTPSPAPAAADSKVESGTVDKTN